MSVAWRWIIGLGAVAVLAVVAWFGGEWIAQQVVTNTVRQKVITELALPADQEVDVEVKEPVIPQLIAGTIDDIVVAVPDVSVEDFTGDVAVHATGVPIRGGGDIEKATAVVSMDAEQLQALLATVDGFPADTVGLEDPNVTMSQSFSVLGVSLEAAIGLTPSAKDGELVLSPDYVKLGGAEISSAALHDRFGSAADAVVREYPVCIAKYLPAGMTLTRASVNGNQFVAAFDIDGAIINEKKLQEKGTCA